MRKLASLCRKLYRCTGLRYVVVSPCRGQYRVRIGYGGFVGDFSSVRDCECFLISLFRED